MPIYEYQCELCANTVEHIPYISVGQENGPTLATLVCEKCGGTYTKIISQSTFNFKEGAPTPKYHS